MGLFKKKFEETKNNKPLAGKGQTVVRGKAEQEDIKGKGGTVIRGAAEMPGPISRRIDWKTGDIILDLYEVTGFLGKGGMGSVYKVLHRDWGIELAVKIPQPGSDMAGETGMEDEIYNRFVIEAETWVNLGLHPHVVSCYYVRKLEGFPGVFAEYVDGGSLSEHISGKKLYSGDKSRVLERILDLAIQFAWGLEYSHTQGLVHQDVKPANVMVTGDGIVKVTDFGLAKAAAGAFGPKKALTGENILVSVGGMTEAYCSPEQSMGVLLNHKTDIWSWGVSILEMFTGKVTWDSGPSVLEALERYVAGGSQYPEIPPMPPGLVSILRQCFKYDPAERPPHMAGISDRLKQIYHEVVGSDYSRTLPPAGRDTADSLNNRAVSLLDLNRQKEAETAWEQALNLQPHHPEATYNRNLVLWRARRLKENRVLENSLKDIIKSQGEKGNAYLLTAMTRLELGDCPAALQALEKVTPDDVDEKQLKTLRETAKAKLPYSLGPVRVFKGHQGAVNAVALTPDNRFALSGSEDTLLKLWDVKSNSCISTFKGHTGRVKAVSLNRDGQLAVSGSEDGNVKLWHIAKKTLIRSFAGHNEAVRSVYLSGDNRHILSHHVDGTVKIWETQSGQCVRTFARLAAAGSNVSVPPTWQYRGPGVNPLIIAGQQGITVWDMDKETSIRFYKTSGFKANHFYHGEGSRYGVTADQDRNIRIWDMNSGELIRTCSGHESEVRTAGLSSDGKYAISGSVDRTIKLWEISTGVLIRTFSGHTDEVTAACFSRDNQYVLTGSRDYTVRMWRVRTYPFFHAPMMLSRVTASKEVISLQEQFEAELTAAIRALAQSNPAAALPHVRRARSFRGYERDSHALDTWTGFYISLAKKGFGGGWEVSNLQGHDGIVYAACLSKCNTYALTGGADQTLKLWDTRTGTLIRTFTGHKKAVFSVALSEDGQYAYSGSRDGTIKQWEVFSGKMLRSIPGQSTAVRSVALSGDGRFILGGGSNTPHLWDTTSGHMLRTFNQHPMLVNTVALSGDGQYALTGSNGSSGTLKMWKVASGQCTQTFADHNGYVAAAAISKDGRYVIAVGGENYRQPDLDDFEDEEMVNIVKRVVTGSAGQKAGAGTSVKLWDARSGELIGSFAGHEREILTVALSWDGKYAVSGSADTTLKLWEVPAGRLVHTFRGHTAAVCAVYFSRDGKYIISGSSDGAVKLWLMDWELEDRVPGNWQEGIRPYLQNFLTLHTPLLGRLSPGREPSFIDKKNALIRQGKPTWTGEKVNGLLYDLACIGYGWLGPEEVTKQLNELN